MNVSRLFQRLIGGGRAVATAAAALRSVVAWLFIALVALFPTQPSTGPASAFDAPVPWPAELGLDGNPGGQGAIGYNSGREAGQTAAGPRRKVVDGRKVRTP